MVEHVKIRISSEEGVEEYGFDAMAMILEQRERAEMWYCRWKWTAGALLIAIAYIFWSSVMSALFLWLEGR